MFNTIIWATDGSEAADRALPYAKALAEGPGGTLFVVHCKELLIGRGGGYPALADEDDLQGKIRGQVSLLREEGLDTTLKIITAPGSQGPHMIADLAREIGADAIVVGTRGHSPVAGLLLGSLTQRLLHIAPCPVVAVPAGIPTTATRADDKQAAAARN
jgi:nucleotide-binding universal stress UspA family protein